MLKTTRGKLAIALTAIVFSGTSFVALADNPAQKNANGQSDAPAQAKQGEKGPEVRFGNPSRTIGSDADQRDYDAQDGGITGVAITGSRVFETRVSNAAAPRPATTVLNLTKHTGNPMPVTKIVAIYWGTGFPAGYQAAVDSYLGVISSPSNALNSVTNQYFVSPAKNAMSFVRSYTDTTSTPPTSAPTTASILAEAYKVVVTQNGGTMDPAGLYMVFTNNFPARANFCAWHGAGSVNGKPFTIAYQPYLGTMAGCAASYMAGYTVGSTISGVDAVANVASHEIYETITDPQLNAWFDANGAEIGDKCSWNYGSTKVGAYSVQTEWSNSAKGCARS